VACGQRVVRDIPGVTTGADQTSSRGGRVKGALGEIRGMPRVGDSPRVLRQSRAYCGKKGALLVAKILDMKLEKMAEPLSLSDVNLTVLNSLEAGMALNVARKREERR